MDEKTKAKKVLFYTDEYYKDEKVFNKLDFLISSFADNWGVSDNKPVKYFWFILFVFITINALET